MSEPTKSSKISGSVEKSELYRTLTIAAAEQLEKAAEQRDRIGDGDRASSERYRLLACEARILADEFATWPTSDPSSEVRIRATARLMDLRAIADEASRRP